MLLLPHVNIMYIFRLKMESQRELVVWCPDTVVL